MNGAVRGRPAVGTGVWVVAVVAAGLVIPGLGIVIALVLAFTRLRDAPAAVRWGLVGVGVAVLVVQLVGLNAGPWTSGNVTHSGPVSPR